MRRACFFSGLIASIALLLFASSAAWADSFASATTPAALGANDQTSWSQLGPDGTPVPSTFTAISALGNVITGTLQGGGDGGVSVSCGNNMPTATCSWGETDIPAGHSLLWTNQQGPLSLAFSTSASAVGLVIQSQALGTFTGELDVYDGSTLLTNLIVTSDPNGDSVFMGLQDLSGANITSAVVSLDDCTAPCTDDNFAVDTLYTTDHPGGATPEPSSVLLLGTGLAGLISVGKRRFSTHSF